MWVYICVYKGNWDVGTWHLSSLMSISGDGRCMFSHSFTSSATYMPVLSLPLQLPLSISETILTTTTKWYWYQTRTKHFWSTGISIHTEIYCSDLKQNDSIRDLIIYLLMCLNQGIIQPSWNFCFWNDPFTEFRLSRYFLLKPIFINQHLSNHLYLIVVKLPFYLLCSLLF